MGAGAVPGQPWRRREDRGGQEQHIRGVQPGAPGEERPFIINRRQLTSATARCLGLRGPFRNRAREAAVIIFVSMVPDSLLAL